MKTIALTLFLAVTACGRPVEERGPVLAPGDYTMRVQALDREGTCDDVPPQVYLYVTVDAEGSIDTRDPELTCTTTYADGSASFSCRGFGMAGTLRGAASATTAALLGEARGDVNGCTRLVLFATVDPR
jgi:hypothetical protein